VRSSHERSGGPNIIEGDTNEVGSEALEGRVECTLIVFSLALAEADKTFTVANENENTSVVHSVEGGDISNSVRVDENELEFSRVEHFVFLGFKVALRTRRDELLLCVQLIKMLQICGTVRSHTFTNLTVLLGFFIVVLDVFAASELFEHDHFVAAELGTLGQEELLLLVLGRVDDVGPALLILGLESAEELIERLVTFSHGLDAGVEGLSTGLGLLLDEVLQFLDLLDVLWSASGFFAASFASVGKKEHLILLELVLVFVKDQRGLSHLTTALDSEPSMLEGSTHHAAEDAAATLDLVNEAEHD
jgi:hypothetical protein